MYTNDFVHFTGHDVHVYEHRPMVTDMNIPGWNTSHYGCKCKSEVMFRTSLNIHNTTKQYQ